jgi:hypothetical protein
MSEEVLVPVVVVDDERRLLDIEALAWAIRHGDSSVFVDKDKAHAKRQLARLKAMYHRISGERK